MKKSINEYIEDFNNILNFNNMSWWIIDHENDPDHFYCNQAMIDSFNLNPSLEKHSVAQTCPIAGDYLKNVKLASSEKANIVLKEYFELLNNQRDEYKNVFPYYDENTDSVQYFLSRSKALTFDEEGSVAILYGIIENITDKISQENYIEEYNSIIDKYVITSTSNKNGVIETFSSAYSELSGYTKEEVIGKNHNVLRHPDTKKEFFEELWQTITSGKKWQGEIKNKKKDGTEFWLNMVVTPRLDELDNIKYFTTVSQDITDKKIIEKLLNIDKLTNVYNRAKLDNLLERELIYANRYKTSFSIIMLDIDFFKSVNDELGHIQGDNVLIEFAKLLREHIRKTDYIGRWGGEEFLIICPNSNLAQGEQVALKLKEVIRNYDFGLNKRITASFGVSIYKENDSSDDLLIRADKALYKAKELGRDRVEITQNN